VFVSRFTAFFTLLITITLPAFAWGPEGHQVVADIARSHLTAAAKLSVRELLGNDDLAAASTWADEIKSGRPETSGWHFVDIPRNSSGFSEERDCDRPEEKYPSSLHDHHNCVVDRISMFEQVLANRKASRQDRIEALKFLVHLVGDIHQPLHAIADARGGNDIHVTEFGSIQCGKFPCNLHFVWDIGLIEHAGRSEKDYAIYLEKLILRERLMGKADGTPEDWANESLRLAKQVWLNEGSSVDEAYYRANIPMVDERLALAGLRLAKTVNRVFAK
jgi:S1/P1 Nuclease